MMRDRILDDLRNVTRNELIAICRMMGRSFNYSDYYDFDNHKAGRMMRIYGSYVTGDNDITLWFDENDKLVNFANY